MKYKDLKMGDWFIHDGRKYIKTETYSGDIVNISLENDTFGTPVPSINDEEEVNFLTKILYRERKDYEIPDKDSFIIEDMPEGILCRFKNFEWYFTIYHGYFIDICNKFPGRLWGLASYWYNGYNSTSKHSMSSRYRFSRNA